MTTITTAHAALKSRADAINSLDAAHRFWQDEDNVLPASPETFAFFEIVTDPGDFVEFGGGVGNNRERVTGSLHAYVFSPRPTNLETMLPLGEEIAAVYRSFRPGTVMCNAATVLPIGEGTSLVPSGVASEAGNYKCVLVVVDFYFDQVG